MQICFYFPSLKNDQNKAIFGSMYSSYFKQLEGQGLSVKFTTELHEIDGEILVVGLGGGGEKAAAKAMYKFNGPVIIGVYNAYISFYKPFLKRWRSRILFAYNPDFAKLNYDKYNSVGIPYYHFPFGSDNSVFHPLNIEKKYDIAFLGNANSGSGRGKYIQSLIKYAKEKQLNIFLAGSGWDEWGYPYRIVKHGKETNEIYNQSKICVNIHNDRQFAGIDKEMDANNRLFDLAMAGCCQVSNGEQMIIRYFEKDEVDTADKPDDWIEKIDYYLKNEDKRIERCEKSRKRALADHTWELRAIEFSHFINENLPYYKERDQKIGLLTKTIRYLDQFMLPPYQFKEIKILKHILSKLNLYDRK